MSMPMWLSAAGVAVGLFVSRDAWRHGERRAAAVIGGLSVALLFSAAGGS